MTQPHDPSNRVGDQSPWNQVGQPSPPTAQYGYQPVDPAAAYGPPGYGPPGYGPAPTGQPGPPKKSKGPAVIMAVLGVAVVGLGVGLVVALNRDSETPAAGSTTVTVTSAGAVVTETVAETGSDETVVTVTKTDTETVVETVTDGSGEPAGSGAAPAPPTTGRLEGTIGEPVALVWDATTGAAGGGQGTITVNSVTWVDKFEGEFGEDIPDHGAFLVLDVTYEATEGAIPYNTYSWYTKDVDSKEYRDALVFNADDLTLLRSGELPAGDKVRGNVVFDMPKGDGQIIYSLGFSDAGAGWKIPV